jgi:hypothetical protein
MREADRNSYEQHLLFCPPCLAQNDKARPSLAALAGAAATPPPEDLLGRLTAMVDARAPGGRVYWKFLRAGAVSPFTGFTWVVGQWVTSEENTACAAGIHACRAGDLPYWLTDELWRIDLGGPVVEGEHKVVAQRARLLERVDGWTAGTARLFATACVGRAAEHAAAELRTAGCDEAADRLDKGAEGIDEAAGRPDRLGELDKLGEGADRVDGQPLYELAATARDIMESLPGHRTRQATKLCGYVIDAIEAIEDYTVATVAYFAARAANQRSGPGDTDFYTAERAWQASWLAEKLHLTG